MKKTNSIKWLSAVLFPCILFTACDPDESSVTGVVTFEDVALDSTGYWNGSDMKGTHSTYTSGWSTQVDAYSGAFVSGILRCNNVYEVDEYGAFWRGMACSNHTDMTTVGYTNQYSVFETSGAGGSAQFGLIQGDSAMCTFNYEVRVNSLMINNATYPYLTMRYGMDGASGMARKFTEGDYFMVSIAGIAADGSVTGYVHVYLADLRDGKDIICNTWTKIPLDFLGSVKSLLFTFFSTDSGSFGINTPAYACIDNISYTLD